MKFYDVLAISPITGRETTFRETPACHLRVNVDGEMIFRYNHHFDGVEVITATLVPEQRLKNLANEYTDL